MTGSHDSLIKWTFSNVRYAAVELRAMLPPALLAKLDLSTLQLRPGSFVDRDLRQSHTDLLYSVQLASRQAYIYLLLEHQSDPDGSMPFRLLAYLVRVWQDHLRRAERGSGTALPLPLIIPLVVHQGPNGWTKARHFHELFDPELLQVEGVANLVPSFSFLLDDLVQQSDAALLARARDQAELLVSLALWALRDARSRERLLNSLLQWAPIMQAAGQSDEGSEALATLWGYFFMVTPDLSEHDFAQALSAALPDSQGPIMATLAEQWMKKGRAQGLAKGLEKGLEKGLNQGRRDTLARLLELKFGPTPDWAQTRLTAASREELARWTERVLGAESLEAVFAD